MRGTSPLRSSLTLEMLLTLSWYYIPVYFVPTIIVFLYKEFNLPYPRHTLGAEMAFVCLYVFVEAGRVTTASRGNRTEQVVPILWSLVLSLFVLAFHAYYISFQTYVLRVDQVLNGIGLVFVSLESLMELFCGAKFYRYNHL